MWNKKRIGMSLCVVMMTGAMVVVPVCASNQKADTTSESSTDDFDTKIAELEKEYDKIFTDENSDLWEKLQEAEQKLSDAEYCSDDFSEIEFVQKTDALTEEEKAELTDLLKQEEKLDAQMDELCAKEAAAEWNALTKEQQEAVKKEEALCDQENEIYDNNEELWNKVADAELDLSDDEFCSDDFDEVAFINKMDNLTDTEKETLVKDLEKIQKLEDQISELEETLNGTDYADEEV